MHYIVHPDRASLPAYAACAAQQQGKFEAYERAVWDKLYGKTDYTEDNLTGLAKELGLNTDKFKKDMSSDACKGQVQEQMKRLSAVGVGGTPAFLINGRFLSGARPVEQFKAIIDEELKKAETAIAAGKASAENYYQKMVVEQGKKSLQ
jgi:predicted DsbA family dithiol-disulfide isomerase